MKSLLGYVKKKHGRKVANTIRTLFNNIALPIPLSDEFFISCDSGLMVFLEDEACVLRFISPTLSKCDVSEPIEPIIDPDVLQPFGIKKLDNDLYFEILPGVTCGASKNEYRIMIDRLTDKGYISADSDHLFYRNSGLLPDGTPVIIDRGAVRQLNDAVKDVKISLGSQDRFFSPLSEAFRQAWPKEQEQPDREKMVSLWAKCRKMKKQGTLVAGWNTIPEEECYNISEIRGAAIEYYRHRHA